MNYDILAGPCSDSNKESNVGCMYVQIICLDGDLTIEFLFTDGCQGKLEFMEYVLFRTLVLEKQKLKLEVLLKGCWLQLLVSNCHGHTLTHMFLECCRTLVSTATQDSPHSLFSQASDDISGSLRCHTCMLLVKYIVLHPLNLKACLTSRVGFKH